MKDVKGNLYGLVDAPLSVIAKKLDKKNLELTEREKLVESLGTIRKEKNTDKRKARHKVNAKRQKDEIKEHFSIIKDRLFKKKK